MYSTCHLSAQGGRLCICHKVRKTYRHVALQVGKCLGGEVGKSQGGLLARLKGGPRIPNSAASCSRGCPLRPAGNHIQQLLLGGTRLDGFIGRSLSRWKGSTGGAASGGSLCRQTGSRSLGLATSIAHKAAGPRLGSWRHGSGRATLGPFSPGKKPGRQPGSCRPFPVNKASTAR